MVGVGNLNRCSELVMYELVIQINGASLSDASMSHNYQKRAYYCGAW